MLVTDWNPLTVYFFEEFYVRISVEDYVTDDRNMENSFVHLVNNRYMLTLVQYYPLTLAFAIPLTYPLTRPHPIASGRTRSTLVKWWSTRPATRSTAS